MFRGSLGLLVSTLIVLALVTGVIGYGYDGGHQVKEAFWTLAVLSVISIGCFISEKRQLRTII